MLTSLAPAAALLLSVGLVLAGAGLQATLLPVRGTLAGFSAFELGILGSAFFAGFGLGCVLGPKIVRRIGHIRAFAAMASLASCGVLIHAVVVDPYVWWGVRALTGMTIAVLSIVSESWLNDKATNANRGRMFSVYALVNQSMIAMGQLIIVLGNPAAFPLFAVASVLMSIAVIPVSMTAAAAPKIVEAAKMPVRQLYRSSPVAVVATLGAGLSNGSFTALAPVAVQDATGSASIVAWFMTLAVASGAAAQFPLGRLSDRTDRRWVIVAGAGVGALSGVVLATLGSQWGTRFDAVALGCVMVWGACAFTLYPLSAAHMNDHVGRDAFVEASGSLLLVFATGAGFGPILASVQVYVFGIQSAFFFPAAVQGLVLMFVLYRMTRRAKVPAEAQGAFAQAYTASQTVSSAGMGEWGDGESERAAVATPPSPPQAGPSRPS